MIGFFVLGVRIISLLKGVSEKILTKEIVAGKSISLCFPKHKIYSSAIVGDIPIATGVAFSNKIQKIKSKVFVLWEK